jgi:DNA polymerase-3 subunit epsilon
MPEPTIPTFGWFDQAPDNLKTKAQLAALGLRPGGPVAARVVWRGGRRFADLYDQATAKPKRAPSAAQLAALARAQGARRTCPGCGKVYSYVLPARWTVDDCGRCWDLRAEKDRAAARETAAAWLADPEAAIVDFETTDLPGYVVEIAAISTSGMVLLHDRLDPRAPIAEEATAVHGIRAADVAGLPTFADLSAIVAAMIGGRAVIAYNSAFEESVFCLELRRLDPLRRRACEPARWCCAMDLYAAYVGEPGREGEYRWQPLPGGDHTALGDARATLALLRGMVTRG